jgi:hypothetical protein
MTKAVRKPREQAEAKTLLEARKASKKVVDKAVERATAHPTDDNVSIATILEAAAPA